MRVIAVSGSASGIGAATRARLEAAGDRVIGMAASTRRGHGGFRHGGGTAPSRRRIRRAAGGRLDGLVVCAGIGPQAEPWSAIVSLNYFGAQTLLAELRDLLAAGTQPAAVAVSSNSAGLPGMETPIVAACLDGDEAEARRLALTYDGQRAYAGSKLALARWVRTQALRPEWAVLGFRLNAVVPGAVQTPLLQAGLDHPVFGDAIRGFPDPARRVRAPRADRRRDRLPARAGRGVLLRHAAVRRRRHRRAGPPRRLLTLK